MSSITPKQRERLALVETAIGYVFKNTELLSMALTHISYLGVKEPRILSYQRLEFLGDHILGLVVSDMLYKAYPAAEEGELSRRLAELVRAETCAEIATSLGLPAALRLGNSEIHTGVRRKIAIIADIMESVLGAVYLDGGLSASEKLISHLWHERMVNPKRPLRDAKTALQEWAQHKFLTIPHYIEVARKGPDHAPIFIIEARIEGLKSEQGEGNSKRVAEQAAAAAFLAREGGILNPEEYSHDA